MLTKKLSFLAVTVALLLVGACSSNNERKGAPLGFTGTWKGDLALMENNKVVVKGDCEHYASPGFVISTVLHIVQDGQTVTGSLSVNGEQRSTFSGAVSTNAFSAQTTVYVSPCNRQFRDSLAGAEVSGNAITMEYRPENLGAGTFARFAGTLTK